jgi:thiol-disulfide isomerase/thioredoxin
MARWIALVAAVALVAFVVLKFGGYLDLPDRAKMLRNAIDEHSKSMEEAMSAYRQAKSQADQKTAQEKLPNPAPYVQKALKIADVDPTDQTAFEALGFVFNITAGNEDRAVDLLTEYHAKDPKIKAACWLALNLAMNNQLFPPGIPKLMKKVLEENPDKEACGLACFYLGSIPAPRADAGDKEALADVEKYLQRVIREYPDVVLPNKRPAGEAAKTTLDYLHNFAVGMQAPNAESEDLKGSKVQLKDYRGKVVVLDIWATWCGPCRQMIPHEREMVAKFKAQPFELVSISADDKKETLEEFLKKEPMPWAHWWDGPKGRIMTDWYIAQFPTIYVLDAQGVIRYKNIRGEELEKAVAKLVDETKK